MMMYNVPLKNISTVPQTCCGLKVGCFFFLHPTQTLYRNSERRHKFSEVFDHKEAQTVYMSLLLLLCSSICMALLIKADKRLK